jgi:hypothetical protein
MANPNIVNVTSIYSNTAVGDVTTSTATIFTNIAASGKVYKLASLYIANVHASNSGTVTVSIGPTATPKIIANAISIPVNTTINIIDKVSPINFLEGHLLNIIGSAASTLTYSANWEEISAT